jgi:hypothetical protein
MEAESNTLGLRAPLCRLRLHTRHRTLTFEAYLVQLQHQRYLDHTCICAAGGSSHRRGCIRGATQQGAVGGGENSDEVWAL